MDNNLLELTFKKVEDLEKRIERNVSEYLNKK